MRDWRTPLFSRRNAAASLGEIFPTFRRIVLPSLSSIEWTKKKNWRQVPWIHSANNTVTLGTEKCPQCSFVAVLWADWFYLTKVQGCLKWWVYYWNFLFFLKFLLWIIIIIIVTSSSVPAVSLHRLVWKPPSPAARLTRHLSVYCQPHFVKFCVNFS